MAIWRFLISEAAWIEETTRNVSKRWHLNFSKACQKRQFTNDNKIVYNYQSGLLTGMILIDLQNVLDTVSNKKLLNKLEAMHFLR